MSNFTHQYIDRPSGRVCTEKLFADSLIRLLYSPVREQTGWLFRKLTGAAASSALARMNFDLALGSRVLGNRRFLEEAGVDLSECLDPPEALDTARKVFERRIRFWECRPLPELPHAVVSPADARVLTGSLDETEQFFIKEKFFSFCELLGEGNTRWLEAFTQGAFAIFRLTPDKYHFNHLPVSGQILDFYTIDGSYNSCNPSAIIELATPYSKNKRTVTIIDSDVPGGTGVGLVAMIEVVALMIGDITQCYSETGYLEPQPVVPGMFVKKGQPKSLYKPGSSTDILLFQRNRIRFADDIVANQKRQDVCSRFTKGFVQPMVETDVQVRSLLAKPSLEIKPGRR